jgi:Leucine-rich repeat (LRR) protein
VIKIDCLENLKQLKELDINHNKVRQFDPNSFEGKLPIKCLKIDDNGLKNFMHIQKLLRLQHLFANSNKITEFYDIEKLSELPYLKELELTGNILYRKPGYRITTIKKLPGLLYLDGRVRLSPRRKSRPRNAQSRRV